jgi:SSS family solute:Na+ symporter
MMPLDWAVIGAYGVGMLVIGWYYSRRSTTSEEYFLGGRNMRSSSVGLSLFASLFSTITYLALPGELINKGPAILCWVFGLPIAYVIVAYLLIPPFMRLRATSAYQILEERLGLTVRLLGSSMFLLTRLLWMALITYITAEKLIVTVMGWDSRNTVYVAATVGLVTLVYTSMGGLRAVVLTDVVQSLILFGAAVVSILLITIRMGGVGAWWPREWPPSWDQQPFFSLDPTVRVTLLGSLLFMTLWWICTSGSDQMAIQRYLATRDARAARRAFLTTLLSNVFVTAVLAALGLALLGFFRANPPAGLSIERDADKFFPYYIVHHLPPGVTGLVIAGLLAAAMSSLSSGINSSSSVIASDFLDRAGLAPASEQARLRRDKVISALIGLIMVVMSLTMKHVSGNIMEMTVRTNHVFVGPLFGLFFMAMFVPFATPLGTVAGALAGAAAAVLIGYWDLITGGPVLSFQLIMPSSLVVNLLVGCGVSLLSGGSGRGSSRVPAETEVEPSGFPTVQGEQESEKVRK